MLQICSNNKIKYVQKIIYVNKLLCKPWQWLCCVKCHEWRLWLGRTRAICLGAHFGPRRLLPSANWKMMRCNWRSKWYYRWDTKIKRKKKLFFLCTTCLPREFLCILCCCIDICNTDCKIFRSASQLQKHLEYLLLSAQGWYISKWCISAPWHSVHKL